MLRIRTGRLQPVVSILHTADAHMTIAGDASSGWEVEVRGRPALVVTGPLGSEQAESTLVWFAGDSHNRDSMLNQGMNGFEGYVAASGVSGFGSPRWAGNGWTVFLESPHLLPDGSVTRGGYSAWMTPAALRQLGLSIGEAIAGGLVVTRSDDGVESPVNARIEELNGGVRVAIPDLTFSRPTIAMRRRGGCGKCGKGKVCKGGRCVKKKGKRRKKH